MSCYFDMMRGITDLCFFDYQIRYPKRKRKRIYFTAKSIGKKYRQKIQAIGASTQHHELILSGDSTSIY